MAIAEITAKPWEPNDPERLAKFRAGEPGKTSDIWTAKPAVAPCPKGDYREWRIEEGTSYQNQLYCRYWGTFINPSTFSCACCKEHAILNWQSKNMREAFAAFIAANGKEAAGGLLASSVSTTALDQKTALELSDEFELE